MTEPSHRSELAQLDDEALVEALREALASEQPSELFLELARTSFSMRDLDAGLATLVCDSLVDDLATSGVRSGNDSQTLVYEFDDGSVTVDVSDDSLSGVLFASPGATISFRRPDGRVGEVAVDDTGWFRLDLAERGPLQLRVNLGKGRHCDLDWVLT